MKYVFFKCNSVEKATKNNPISTTQVVVTVKLYKLDILSAFAVQLLQQLVQPTFCVTAYLSQ